MAVKVKLGTGRRYDEEGIPVRRASTQPLWMRALLAVVVVGLCCLLLGSIVFAYYYKHYEHVVDDRLNNGPLFASTAQI